MTSSSTQRGWGFPRCKGKGGREERKILDLEVLLRDSLVQCPVSKLGGFVDVWIVTDRGTVNIVGIRRIT